MTTSESFGESKKEADCVDILALRWLVALLKIAVANLIMNVTGSCDKALIEVLSRSCLQLTVTGKDMVK